MIPVKAWPKANADLHYAGAEDVCVMRYQYDRDQLWLPLDTTFLFEAFPLDPEPEPYKKHKFKNHPYVQIEDAARIMYPRDNVVYAKQYVLPFKEHKRVNNGAMKALQRHQFPLWDKKPNCNKKPITECLFSLKVSGYSRQEIEAWCNENLRGRYFLRREQVIYFELEFDCLMAKMYFS